MKKLTEANVNKFVTSLERARTEEDVKSIYAKFFEISYNTSDRHDLYTPQVLFEFKYDKNLKNIKARARILAQLIYYVRAIRYGEDAEKSIPHTLCMCDVNEAIITETQLWKVFYNAPDEKYDWDLAPSNPDERLVDDLSETEMVSQLHVYQVSSPDEFRIFAEQLNRRFSDQMELQFTEKKLITEQNFEDVYKYWNDIFGESVRNGTKPSRYFLSDIDSGSSIFFKENGEVLFNIGKDEFKRKKIIASDYEHFWSLYEKVNNPNIIKSILAKIDRLTDETLRRFQGEFFTPIRFAKKALDYIEHIVGKEWWKTGEYRLWDMAAGTGNLQYYLPQDALPYTYLSTISPEDVEHLKKLFPTSTVFLYDYLNDDVPALFAPNDIGIQMQWKMPEKLLKDLNNPDIKWIIFINPPFATSQEAGVDGDSKEGVSDTLIRKEMHKDDLGETSRELFAQFLYRIRKEFKEKQAHLALFSKIKYINATNDQKLRDSIFDFVFKKGFVFSSANFQGTKGKFPVGMLIWDLNEHKKLEEQEIILDIFNERVEKIGKKLVISEHRDNFLSKWIQRPKTDSIFPPFGSAIEVKCENKDRRDRIAKGFLASLMCCGNDVQHQKYTSLLSGPYVSAGGLSITTENFVQAMIVHAARLAPKATWLNDRDQFMKPQGELSEEFINDCTIWNLFSNGNNTASLRNVKYEGTIYQVLNHFFPYPVEEVRQWNIRDNDFKMELTNAQNTFVANWLANKTLSQEALDVFNRGREVYQFYFSHLHQIRNAKFKIESWDAGWWQIKQSLKDVNLGTSLFADLKKAHNVLKSKIIKKLFEYRIITDNTDFTE